MLLTAIKVKLAAMVVVAGINTDEIKDISPEMKSTLEQLAADQKNTEKDVNASLTAALTKIRELAENGDKDANYTLGRWTATGVVQGATLPQTIAFYRLAADKGQIQAKAELGQILIQASAQDPEKLKEGVELIKEAEAGGSNDARLILAKFHMSGVGGVEHSATKAEQLLQKGSEAGDGNATFALYQLYGAGVDGPAGTILKDDKKALEFLKKAADQGNSEAMRTLGTRYFTGDQGAGTPLVEKNPEKALDMFNKAAEKGNSAANLLLSAIYLQGQDDIKRDVKKGLDFLAKAASGNNAAALFQLGTFSESGLGDPDTKEVLLQPNVKNALDLYRRAAQNGDPRAVFNVGVYYENGVVVDRDFEKAFQMYRAAANSGVVQAMHKLGAFYQSGQGVAQDVVAARSWYEMGSENNFAASQVALGAMYEMGVGTRQNATAAANQYLLAADQGDALAMIRLANMYQRGAATPKAQPDLVRAWTYAKMAVDASNSNQQAVAFLSELEKKMSKEQLEESKKIYDQKVKDREAQRGAAAPAGGGAASGDAKGGKGKGEK
ncbi:MAG: SEL1-like repeat protein [Verrucomicrobiales bacterium]|nr:SEL1-like repeat protein [Verrucomicrobiales bacterium]